MEVVTVSPKFQIVIPSAIRKSLDVRPGSKVAMVELDGMIHLVPMGKRGLRFGSMPGLSVKDYRDRRDRY